jgi:aminopeptidase N
MAESKMKKIFFLLFLVSNTFAQLGLQDSGGKLLPEQSCYDVLHYKISVSVNPNQKSISGFSEMKARAVFDFNELIIDLDSTFEISLLILNDKSDTGLKFSHENGKILIHLSKTIRGGEIFKTRIDYSGIPRVAKRPPWDDGFLWRKTNDGTDWITLTCQGGGADIWFPCKDHPSDEPDSVTLQITAPENLVCVGSGKFISEIKNSYETKTWNWFVSTPINNYNVMFYLGPYKPIEHYYTSITGEKFPFTVWVIPESFEKAKEHSKQFVTHMKIMEEMIGPYPFRADKYSVVETPHLGMEHQTAIAYGYGWKNDPDFPIDWLHHHEFSHEWWGNLVTVKDWSDFWIHEGIGLYMQPLYLEKLYGREKYIGYLKKYKRIQNKKPVAPRGELTSGEAYTGDIYNKGAWIVHTLRFYVGDEIFFKILRRWAYPTEEMEKITNGKQCRNADTDEIMRIAENISGKKLDWFFEVYLRNAPLPILNYKKEANKLLLWWETVNNLPFNLPVEVKNGEKISRVEMKNGKGELLLNENNDFIIDPNEWILMEIAK